jgi:hypothetical protein
MTLEQNVMTLARQTELLATALRTNTDNLSRCIELVGQLSEEIGRLTTRVEQLERPNPSHE